MFSRCGYLGLSRPAGSHYAKVLAGMAAVTCSPSKRTWPPKKPICKDPLGLAPGLDDCVLTTAALPFELCRRCSHGGQLCKYSVHSGMWLLCDEACQGAAIRQQHQCCGPACVLGNEAMAPDRFKK